MASCGSQGRHTRPDFEPKVSGLGSQRVPLLMVMNASSGTDASHKRRLEYRLMVRRRDPQGLRQRGREFEELSSQG